MLWQNIRKSTIVGDKYNDIDFHSESSYLRQKHSPNNFANSSNYRFLTG